MPIHPKWLSRGPTSRLQLAVNLITFVSQHHWVDLHGIRPIVYSIWYVIAFACLDFFIFYFNWPISHGLLILCLFHFSFWLTLRLIDSSKMDHSNNENTMENEAGADVWCRSLKFFFNFFKVNIMRIIWYVVLLLAFELWERWTLKIFRPSYAELKKILAWYNIYIYIYIYFSLNLDENGILFKGRVRWLFLFMCEFTQSVIILYASCYKYMQ